MTVPTSRIASVRRRPRVERDTFGPLAQRREMRKQVTPKRRKPVPGSVLMLDKPRSTQITKPLREHGSGHVRDRRSKRAVGHRLPAKRPQYPERPAPPQHIEQCEQGSIVARLVRCHVACLPQRASYLGTSHVPTGTVAAIGSHSESSALISDAVVNILKAHQILMRSSRSRRAANSGRNSTT
jgi:hypothetical protein